MSVTHRPSRVWIHADFANRDIEERLIPRWRHVLDVALCWLHDRLVTPPNRYSQQVQEKRDWKRWYEDAYRRERTDQTFSKQGER